LLIGNKLVDHASYGSLKRDRFKLGGAVHKCILRK
jgi:hypothetical protein